MMMLSGLKKQWRKRETDFFGRIKMKNHFKKIIAAILCLSLTLSFCAMFSFAREPRGSYAPTVTVVGQGSDLFKFNDDKTHKEKIYPVDISPDFIISQTITNFPHFVQGVITKDYDIIAEDIYETVMPYFEELALNEKGEAENGSGTDFKWSADSINTDTREGRYSLGKYYFNYDWRIDPYAVADTLHRYILDICKATGFEKINLVGRCYGSVIAAAYLDKYGGEHIKECVFYCSALNGITMCNALFTGDITFDADSIDRYAGDMEIGDDESLDMLLKSIVSALNKTGGLDLTAREMNIIYDKVLRKALPKIIRDTLATFPGMWAMVSHRCYEKAKEVIFAGDTAGKYDYFKSLIDNYHYNVQVKAPEIIKKLENEGVEFAVISKYGYAGLPISEESAESCDNCSTLTDSSFGATTENFGKTFSPEYLGNARINGTEKYISPDKQVDASTCVLPDKTWFIKNIEHKDFPDCVDILMEKIFNNDGFDIGSDSEFCQYLVYDVQAGSLSPMTKENMNTEKKYEKSFFRILYDFFRSLFDIIISLTK